MNDLISVVLGGIITWLVSWCYYKRAGQELKDEAAELRRLNTLMLQGMQHAGWIKLNRGPSGEITGFEKTLYLRGESHEEFGNPTISNSQPLDL